MNKKLLVFITIMSIIFVIWINKLYLVDGIETYHSILSKVMILSYAYIFVMYYQIKKKEYKIR